MKNLLIWFNKHGICFCFIAGFVILMNMQTYEYGVQLELFSFLQNILLVTSFTTFVALICAMFIYLIFGRRTPGALAVLSFITTFVFFADSCYTHYSSSPISVSQIVNVNQLMDTSMADSILNVINKHSLRIVLFYLLFLVAYVIYKIKVINKSEQSKIKERYKVQCFNFLYRTIIATIVIFMSISGLSFVKTRASALNVFWTKSMLINQVGLPYYHIWDVSTFISFNFRDQTLTQEEKQQFKDLKQQINTHKKPKYFGVDKGKNVIFLQVEALQQFVIGAKIDGIELTPNLNKLIKNEIYLDNFYPQTGLGNTADCEYISLNSMLPSTLGVVNETYQHNEFYSIAHKLKDEGYTANSYHSYEESFWNRNVMHPKYGLDKFYSKKDFTQEEVIGWSDSDESFYKQVLDKREKLGDKPKFSYLTSLTCHFPFIYYQNPNLDTSKFKGKLMGDYLHGVTYSDYAIGELIKGLKERDEYDNTLIVIYGDHKAINDDELDCIYQLIGEPNSFKNAEFSYEELEKVPLLIINSNAKKGTIHNIAGQVDIAPTVCNLLGIENDFGVGRNIFDITNKNAGIIKASGTIVTNGYVISAHKTVYDRKEKETIKYELLDSDTINTIEFLKNQKKVSDILLSKDAVLTYKNIGEK